MRKSSTYIHICIHGLSLAVVRKSGRRKNREAKGNETALPKYSSVVNVWRKEKRNDNEGKGNGR